MAGEDSVDVTRAVALLRAQGMDRILCEGAPTLLDGLVDTDAIVEICVTLAPNSPAASAWAVDSRHGYPCRWRCGSSTRWPVTTTYS